MQAANTKFCFKIPLRLSKAFLPGWSPDDDRPKMFVLTIWDYFLLCVLSFWFLKRDARAVIGTLVHKPEV